MTPEDAGSVTINNNRKRILDELSGLSETQLQERIDSIRKEARGLNLKTQKGAEILARRIDGNAQAWELVAAVQIMEEKYEK